MSDMKIENKNISDYKSYLKENYRPPSKGGNTSALHSHVIEIEGETYSFLAPGSQQWVFKTDTVSFGFEINSGYKNIITESIVTIDRKGQTVVRGNRGYKQTLRTVQTRMPASKREQRD
jgi:hypothetical protein